MGILQIRYYLTPHDSIKDLSVQRLGNRQDNGLFASLLLRVCVYKVERIYSNPIKINEYDARKRDIPNYIFSTLFLFMLLCVE